MSTKAGKALVQSWRSAELDMRVLHGGLPGSGYDKLADGYGTCADELEAALSEAGPDWSSWTPTAAHINALPERLRSYIHQLETVTDPAGDLRELVLTRDENAMLRAKLAEPVERAETPDPWATVFKLSARVGKEYPASPIVDELRSAIVDGYEWDVARMAELSRLQGASGEAQKRCTCGPPTEPREPHAAQCPAGDAEPTETP